MKYVVIVLIIGMFIAFIMMMVRQIAPTFTVTTGGSMSKWYENTRGHISKHSKRILWLLGGIVGWLAILYLLSEVSPWWDRWMSPPYLFFFAHVLFLIGILLPKKAKATTATKTVKKEEKKVKDKKKKKEGEEENGEQKEEQTEEKEVTVEAEDTLEFVDRPDIYRKAPQLWHILRGVFLTGAALALIASCFDPAFFDGLQVSVSNKDTNAQPVNNDSAVEATSNRSYTSRDEDYTFVLAADVQTALQSPTPGEPYEITVTDTVWVSENMRQAYQLKGTATFNAGDTILVQPVEYKPANVVVRSFK